MTSAAAAAANHGRCLLLLLPALYKKKDRDRSDRQGIRRPRRRRWGSGMGKKGRQQQGRFMVRANADGNSVSLLNRPPPRFPLLHGSGFPHNLLSPKKQPSCCCCPTSGIITPLIWLSSSSTLTPLFFLPLFLMAAHYGSVIKKPTFCNNGL